MRKSLLLMSLLMFVFALNVLAADVSGIWALKMKGPQGEESFDMVIKATGENLSVTATHPSLQGMTGTGTLKGDTIKFNLKTTGKMQVQFDFSGTVSGNKMTGNFADGDNVFSWSSYRRQSGGGSTPGGADSGVGD